MSVSIIIPVHNSVNYLDDCIISVLKQCSENDEILLIENGSMDNTPEMCKQYAEQYKNIRYYEIGPEGVSVARNLGIQMATSEWIMFLDSDDMLQDGALSVVNRLSDNDAEIVIGNYSRSVYNDNSKIQFKNVPKDLLKKTVLQYAKYWKKIRKYAPIDNYNNWACWGKFFKREFIQRNNIQFPIGITHSEDTAFCFQAYCVAKHIIATCRIIYYYRDNPLSVVSNYAKHLDLNNIKLVEIFEGYRLIETDESMFSLYYSFYVRKVIDVYYNIRKNTDKENSRKYEINRIKRLCANSIVASAIRHTGYCKIIVGRRNTLQYMFLLFILKRRWYKYLFLF